MQSSVLTIRVSPETREQLEKLALATQRSKSYLAAEAIEKYLALEAWQVAEVEQALREADAGEFASEDELAAVLKKHAG